MGTVNCKIQLTNVAPGEQREASFSGQNGPEMGPEITPRRGLGGSQERPGGLCEPSWPSSPLLKPSYSHLGPSWGPLRAIFGRLGDILGPLGPSRWQERGFLEIIEKKNHRFFNIFALRTPRNHWPENSGSVPGAPGMAL